MKTAKLLFAMLCDVVKDITGRNKLEQRLWKAEMRIDALKGMLEEQKELIDSLCASALVNLNGIDEETRNAATRASHKAGHHGSRMVSVEIRRNRLRELDNNITSDQVERFQLLQDWPELQRGKP